MAVSIFEAAILYKEAFMNSSGSGKQNASPRLSEILFPVFLMALGAFVLITSLKFQREAGLFPIIVSCVEIALSILLLLKNHHAIRFSGTKTKAESFSFKTIVVVIGVFLYPIFILAIGFFPASTAFLIVCSYLLGVRDLKKLIILTVLLLFFIYVVFAVCLNIKFPIGVFFGGELGL